MKKSLLFVSLFLTSALYSTTSSILDKLTLTKISFNIGDDGNLNPNIFVPFYYGSHQQFYSSLSYESSNFSESITLDSFSDSKSAFFSTSRDLTLNYITYITSFFGLQTSFGIESRFSKVENNEFGYIHDQDNLFGQGSDYYTSFDNTVQLDIQRHSFRADIVIPMGQYFSSRLFGSVSPYSTIGVKQSTIFKPLSSDTGTSNSTTIQDISYTLKYDALIKTDIFVNFGIEAYYDSQSLKYDIAQLAEKDGAFTFETVGIDTRETTSRVIGKLLFNIEVLGGLNPSIGYGIEKIDTKDNITGDSISHNNNIITFGVEKLF